MMLTASDGIPLPTFVEHFIREMVRADAQAQMLQQAGWSDFQRSMEKAEGVDITGGMGELSYLGLREVKISFFVEPVRPGFWQRLKRVVRHLLGTPAAAAKQVCRLVPGTQAGVSAFRITLTVARLDDGTFSVKSESRTAPLESSGGVYVTDILS